MKNLKKVFAVIMALAMIFALSTVAFADTLIDHTQDPNYLMLTVSSANSLTYSAVTVEGDGNEYPDVTTYSYYATFSANYSSLNSVTVTAVYPTSYTLYMDSNFVSHELVNGKYQSTINNVDFSDGHILELRNGNTVIRTYQLAGGISGSTLSTVYMRINVQDAVTWKTAHPGVMDDDSEAALSYILTRTGMNANGEMATVAISNVPAGDTVMDVLHYICYGAGSSGVSMMCGNVDITTNGLELALDGTGTPMSYVSGIGKGATSQYLYEFSTESTSGWLYLDQNGFPSYGASQYYLTGGENITWRFVNNFMDYLDF